MAAMCKNTLPRLLWEARHYYYLGGIHWRSISMPKSNYKELVAQAEKAVSSVSDPSLKQIAFQKVLDDLLRSSRETDEGSDQTAPTRGKAPKPKKRENLRGAARGGPTQYIQELLGDGFFQKPKSISEVKAELGNRGHHIPITHLSNPLMRLCRAKVLRRQKSDTSAFATRSYSAGARRRKEGSSQSQIIVRR
jgi:hypothetical protein